MRVVNAQERFAEAQEVHQEAVNTQDWEKRQELLRQAEQMYNEILNHNIGNPHALYLIAALAQDRRYHGLAIAILERVVSEHPKFGEAWNNLGIAWQEVKQRDRADECFHHCIEALEEFKNEDIYVDALCNRAGTNLNQGRPLKALGFAEQALSVRPDHKKSQWHKAMALLEMQRWDTAWDWHEVRLQAGSADHNIEERNYAEEGMTPWWDGKAPGLIVIHGEQGLGDEIMFSSCIDDMRGEGRKFIFEPSPRSESLFKESFKRCEDIFVYGTHDTDGRGWIKEHGRPDFKIALGSLPQYCRRSVEDFPGNPYLRPPPVAANGYKKRLAKLGPNPKIGIAWQGGVQSTAVHWRSIFPIDFEPLFEYDCDFISLQYTDLAEENIRDSGLPIIHWPDAVDARNPTGKNVGQLAALISNLDMVISVCQTAIHVAGALGIPTLVLTPSRPSWRYGSPNHVGERELPWYNSVELIRQLDEDWTDAIHEAAQRLGDFLKDPGGFHETIRKRPKWLPPLDGGNN